MMLEDRESQLGSPLIKGTLKKKGMGAKVGFYRPWTIRNCVLDTGQKKFLYYDGEVLKGEIPLAGATVRELAPEEADGNHYAFEISNFSTDESAKSKNKSLTLVLSAETQSESELWVQALLSASYISSSSAQSTMYESFHVSWHY